MMGGGRWQEMEGGGCDFSPLCDTTEQEVGADLEVSTDHPHLKLI